jgi:SAM-dependent methyltransferase
MNWDEHFSSRSGVHWSINDSAVEAVIKIVTYKLRLDYEEDWTRLEFLEVGCGGGANLEWLARRGVRVSGIDISQQAIAACKKRLGKYGVRYVDIGEATDLPFEDCSFNGVIEACVFQHLGKEDRRAAFAEVDRVLVPGGLFVGYCLNVYDDVFNFTRASESRDDPGTVILSSGPKGHLQSVGLTHFFSEEEFADLLPNFDVELLPVSYAIPTFEAKRRGMNGGYTNRYFTVYGVKK